MSLPDPMQYSTPSRNISLEENKAAYKRLFCIQLSRTFFILTILFNLFRKGCEESSMSEDIRTSTLFDRKVPLLQDISTFYLKLLNIKNTACSQENTLILRTVRRRVYWHPNSMDF